jgi:hypothetical protein
MKTTTKNILTGHVTALQMHLDVFSQVIAQDVSLTGLDKNTLLRSIENANRTLTNLQKKVKTIDADGHKRTVQELRTIQHLHCVN